MPLLTSLAAHDKAGRAGHRAAMRITMAVVCVFLSACGTPAVLRAPPGRADMSPPQPGLPPIPAIAEPTGQPRIALPVATLDGFTPLAAPRSGRAATP